VRVTKTYWRLKGDGAADLRQSLNQVMMAGVWARLLLFVGRWAAAAAGVPGELKISPIVVYTRDERPHSLVRSRGFAPIF
jgi:hypothetical protein